MVDVSKGGAPGGGVNLTKGQAISLQKRDGGTLTAVRMGLGWQAAPGAVCSARGPGRSTSMPRPFCSRTSSRSTSSSSATW